MTPSGTPDAPFEPEQSLVPEFRSALRTTLLVLTAVALAFVTLIVPFMALGLLVMGPGGWANVVTVVVVAAVVVGALYGVVAIYRSLRRAS